MLFKVSVQFNSNILSIQGDSIIIGVKAKPIKGQANKEIIKKLAKHFGISASKVQIKRGNKSDKKIVEILKEA